jgi:hypothetical protein
MRLGISDRLDSIEPLWYNIAMSSNHNITDLASALELINKMRDIILSLDKENENLSRDYGLALDQRDEARREVCRLEANLYNNPEDEDSAPLSPQDVAHIFHKWDCFDCNKPMCTEHPECAAQADNQGLSDIEKEP